MVLYNKQIGDTGRSPNALSYESLGSCAELIEANMEFARPKAWDLHQHIQSQKELVSRIVKNSSDHRTKQLKSNSVASLHMMSENELASDDKRYHQQIIMAANGKAESTEEATVYVIDSDVFVTMMLLEDSPAVLSLGLLCEEMGHCYEREKGGLHR